jgi:hypothetical protein
MIRRLGFDQGSLRVELGVAFIWVQVGDDEQIKSNFGAGEEFTKGKTSNRLGPLCLFLINHYRWGRSMYT